MEFRAKPVETVVAEIRDAMASYRNLDVVFSDNILDMGHVRDLSAQLVELDCDLHIFAEVKSNLTYRQLEILARSRLHPDTARN